MLMEVVIDVREVVINSHVRDAAIDGGLHRSSLPRCHDP